MLRIKKPKKQEDQADLEAFLQWLVKNLTPNPDGSVSGPFFSFDYRVRVEVLTGCVVAEDLEDTKELIRNFVQGAVIRLAKSQVEKPTLQDFDRALQEVVREHLKKPLQTYQIVFPLHIRGPWIRKKRWLNVLSYRFRNGNWVRVLQKKGWEDFYEEIKVRHPGIEERSDFWSNTRPFWTRVKARSVGEAFYKAESAFDVLRAIANFVKLKRRISMHFGKPSPLGICLPPAIYGVFKEDWSYETHYYNTEYHSYSYARPAEFSPKNGKELEQWLIRLAKLDPRMQDLVVDSLIRYVRALDTIDWRSAFLSLWQVLEGIARPKGEDVRFGEIVKRIVNLTRAGPSIRHLIHGLEASRHSLVHQGRFPKENATTEVSYLKVVSEIAIERFIEVARSLPTPEHFTEYYKSVAQPERMLRTRQEVTKLVLSSPK